VASLAPLAAAELPEAIAACGAAIAAGSDLEHVDVVALLRSLHETLLRATRGGTAAPLADLGAAAAIVGALPVALTDALPARPRTVFRLLRAGFPAAAWEVLVDNGTGLVDEPYDASTATGTARTSPRLPLLTAIESGVVYAQLPGFRDPRYAAPDDCYDVTSAVRLKHQLEEVLIDKTTMTLSGWAALDLLTTGPNERVDLVLTASSGQSELVTSARRVRRADLVSGRNEGLRRRAWAGWSSVVNLTDPRLAAGDWAVWIQVDHDGVVVRQPVGRGASALALAAARASWQAAGRSIRWTIAPKQWTLVITA
jgi:hypothetical protein